MNVLKGDCQIAERNLMIPCALWVIEKMFAGKYFTINLTVFHNYTF